MIDIKNFREQIKNEIGVDYSEEELYERFGKHMFSSAPQMPTPQRPTKQKEPISQTTVPVEQSSMPRRLLGDVAVTAAKSIIGAGETAVGLANIATMGYAGKGLEKLGYDPETTHKALAEYYSPAQQEAFKKVGEAKGFGETVMAAVENPSTIVHSVLESLPSMAGGGAIGRGLAKAGLKASPYVLGAIGEGTVAAGATAENVRQQNEDGLLTPGQAAKAVGTGLGTGIIGVAGGRIAKKLGLGDIDEIFVTHKLPAKTSAGVAKRIIGGGIVEGVFEELPQSAQEQVWANAAMNKPLLEGVEESAALGMLAGMAMGSGANIFTQSAELVQQNKENKEIDKVVENIKSGGDENVIAAVEKIDNDLASFNYIKNNNEALQAEAEKRGVPVENLTAEINQQISWSNKLRERLTGENAPEDVSKDNPVEMSTLETAPIKLSDLESEPVDVNKLLDTKEDDYWAEQEKLIQGQQEQQAKRAALNKTPEYQKRAENQQVINVLAQLEKAKEAAQTPQEKALVNTLLERFKEREDAPANRYDEAGVPILEGPQEEETYDPFEKITQRLGGKVEPDIIFDKDTYRRELLAELEDKKKIELRSFKNEQPVEAIPNQPVEDQVEQSDINLEPSEAQKEAGNYKKAPIKIDNLDIKIENPAGSTRSGKDDDGNEWTSEMVAHYGYFARTEGKDGDQVDVLIRPGTESSPTVYVVDQVNPETGEFDEHKVIMGATSEEDAKKLYLSNYEDGWQGLGNITAMEQADFKEWLGDKKRTKKPLAPIEETTEDAVTPDTEVMPEDDVTTEDDALPIEEKQNIWQEEIKYSQDQLESYREELEELQYEKRQYGVNDPEVTEINLDIEEIQEQMASHEELIADRTKRLGEIPQFEIRKDQTPGTGLNIRELQKMYPGQDVFLSNDNNISIRLKNGKGITIQSINEAGKDFIEYAVETGQMSKDGKILGVTLGNKILLDENFADNKTSWHENFHAVENLGMITEGDLSALNKEFNKLRKANQLDFNISTHEDSRVAMTENRANTFAQIMVNREQYRDTPLGKMIQRVMDFFNQLYVMGRRIVTNNKDFQTTTGLARQFETGQIYERIPDGKTINDYAPIDAFNTENFPLLTLQEKTDTTTPEFINWFGQSRSRKNGKPLIFYHYTNEPFTEFEHRPGENTGHGASGLGHFFFGTKDKAKHFGDIEMPSYLKMEKTYLMPMEEAQAIETIDEGLAIKQELLDQGYDSIIIDNSKLGGKPYMVMLKENNIKSIYNTGTWRQDTNNIYFQIIPIDENNLPKQVKTLFNSPQWKKIKSTGQLYRNKEFFDKTGFWLAKDGKWRYELDDSKVKYNEFEISLNMDFNSSFTKNLSEIISYDELFKTIPKLKNLKVTFDRDAVSSYYSKEKNMIMLNTSDKKALFHEIQHAVNAELGGSYGTSLEQSKIDGELQEITRRFKKIAENSEHPETREKIKEILKEGLHDESDISWFWEKIVPFIKKTESAKLANSIAFPIGVAAEYRYMTNIGEMEARLIENRLNMSTEERKAIPPWETLDKMLIQEGYEKNAGNALFEIREPLPEQKTSDEEYLEMFKQRKNLFGKIKQVARGDLSWIKLGADKILTPISTRLNVMELPELAAKMRWMDFTIGQTINKALKEAHPIMETAKKKMSPEDRSAWDDARKDSDSGKIIQLARKYGIEERYNNLRGILDKIRQDAVDVGYDIGYIEDYWPRVLKDREGFLLATQEISREKVFTDALKDRADKLGVTVSDLRQRYPDAAADIISNLILSRREGIGGPGNIQARKFEKIPAEYRDFYMDSDAALMQYIYSLTKKIEARRFFGKVPITIQKQKQQLSLANTRLIKLEKLRALTASENQGTAHQQEMLESYDERIKDIKKNVKAINAKLEDYKLQERDYTENIGTYINDLLISGQLHKKHEQSLRDLLDARFHEHGTHGKWHTMKNLAYIDVLGNPVAAATQIGDLAWATYVGGYNPAGLAMTAKNIVKAVFNKSNITKEDLGIDRIAQEFADFGSTSRAVSWVFKKVGLEKIDSIGKETLINNALERYQREASTKEGVQKILKKIRPTFGNKSQDVVNELLVLSKNSNMKPSANIKMLLYSRLLDFQPVALSEMPERYLNSGNGRIMYMLKTYTIKQLDVFRNEVWHDLRDGNTNEKLAAMKNMVMLMATLSLANAGADEIKDFMTGKDTKFEDHVIENFLSMGGANKFVRLQARREGIGTAIKQLVLPPTKFIDAMWKDTTGEEIELFNIQKSRSLRSIPSYGPFGGELAYWHLGCGQDYRPSVEEKEFKKVGREIRKFKQEFDSATDKRVFLNANKEEFVQMKIYEKYANELRNMTTLINKLKKMEQTPNIRKRIGQLTKRQEERRQQYFNLTNN